MPSFDQHLSQANHNFSFLQSFFLKQSNDWAITVTFYTSVHLVEGLINKESNRLRNEEDNFDYEIDCSTHDKRESQVKSLFNEIHFAFSELRKSASKGRYKIYNFRNNEVTADFNNHFIPIADFFNRYCTRYKIPGQFNFSDLTTQQ